MCNVEGFDAIAANDHFVVALSRDFDGLYTNVDVMAVSTIHQFVVDVVLYINNKQWTEAVLL